MKRVWLVIPDPMTGRVWFDTGIFDRLRERMGDRLTAVLVVDPKHWQNWASHLDGVPVINELELFPWKVPLPEKVIRRADLWLDKQIGFYPAALRLNLRQGFHSDRIRPGHPHLFLNSDLIGPLPRWRVVERAMGRWLHSPRRYVSHTLLDRMRRECSAVVLANLHMLPSMRFILGARRLRLPVVGYVGSWDHTVGKGLIPSHFDRYIVQNEVMRTDLERYHGVDPARVVVTGWPQSDVFSRRRPRSAYDELLRSYGFDAARPLVVVMGNTPTNMPHERRFVERVLHWRDTLSPEDRPSLLFRPHPLDKEWESRFEPACDREGVYLQSPSFYDFEILATLLQHCDCVVANAGTILLDAIVNDRPSVCVLYDEGSLPGENWAEKNVQGEHYQELMNSSAFYRAHDFDEVVEGIQRALADPDELADERRRVVRRVVGDVDGRAVERVVDAIIEGVPT